VDPWQESALNIRFLLMALIALFLMTFTTVYIGPGIGVEANCVCLQTYGKTLIFAFRDVFLSVRYTLPDFVPRFS
jgi:hypothetical protein